jgi:hypothetical protein
VTIFKGDNQKSTGKQKCQRNPYIELEEAELVDGSFLDVSLVEEVNSNSPKKNVENFSVLCPGSATLDRLGMEHRREVFLIR